MNNAFTRAMSGATGGSEPISRGADSQAARNPALRKVLVVDDESLVRWAIAEKLGEHGFDVTEAADAETAMCELVRAGNRTDLVMLDLRLPDSNDLRILSLIRILSAKLPVILMTAHGTPPIAHEAVRLGAWVLDKPFEMDALVPLVERVIAAGPR